MVSGKRNMLISNSIQILSILSLIYSLCLKNLFRPKDHSSTGLQIDANLSFCE